MKAVCRMIAAGLLLALLAGCGAGQSSYEWAVEPQLQADKIEPLAVSGGGMLEGSLPEGEALLALCAAQKGGLWGLVDGHTGEWVVEPRFSQHPTLCPDGHLLAAGLDGTLLSDPELDRQLAAYDPDLQTEPGHGGLGVEYVWDEEAGQVRRHSWNESGAECPILEPDTTGELLPVRQGIWEYNQLEGAQVMKAQPKSLYAVATADGKLLSDFVYEQARPGSGGLIAVEKKGKWGYLNGQGELVIPCKYDGVWGQSADRDVQGNDSAVWQRIWPAPCLEAGVVVRKGGEYTLLSSEGKKLIGFGTYQALAPAPDGLVWAKQNGLWGLLRPVSGS